jgi:hypothetical protein
VAVGSVPTVGDSGTVGEMSAPGAPIVTVAGGPTVKVGVPVSDTGLVGMAVAGAGRDGVLVGKTTTGVNEAVGV